MQVSAVQTMPQMGASNSSQAAKLGRAASEFEALFVAQMLRSARESSADDSDDSDGAATNSPLMDLGEQQFAQALTNNGGLGLAKIVVTGLSKDANR